MATSGLVESPELVLVKIYERLKNPDDRINLSMTSRKMHDIYKRYQRQIVITADKNWLFTDEHGKIILPEWLIPKTQSMEEKNEENSSQKIFDFRDLFINSDDSEDLEDF